MGITIVIITHEMSVVESTCTHVAIIDDGRLAECGTVESVFSQPKSAAAKKLIFRTTGADSGAMGERMIRIVFEGSSADEPTISDLAMQCHVAVNIRYARHPRGQRQAVRPDDFAAAGRSLAAGKSDLLPAKQGLAR